MKAVADKFKVDVCNYFSLEVLDNMGIYKPNQQQIDEVAETIRKAILLTNKGTIAGQMLNLDDEIAD